MSTQDLQQVESELVLVESQLKIEEAKARTAIIKQAAQPLTEHWDYVPHAVDKFSFRDPHFFADGFPHRHTPWSLMSDREDGKFFPLYETEMDLARIRGKSRNLAAFTSTTIGAVEALKNYVYGTGFTYTVQEVEGVEAEELVKQAQRIIDTFIETNDFTGVIDVENHQRSREDGEAFIHIQNDGPQILVDLIEPDNVTEPFYKRPSDKHEMEKWVEVVHGIPMDTFVPSWKFGILTPERQTWRALGYHVVFDSAGNDWEFVPESRMVHIKRNVPRKAKRGVSDFVPVWEDIEAEARLRKNTAEGAAIQAAIAFIREHVPGVSKTDIVDFVAATATTNYDKSIKDGTRTVQAEKFMPGTVKDIPEGMKYHAGPMGTLRSPIFIEVAQFILRSIGQRWSFPEFIISGDASNANFSSTLVAESPFVKARECDQQFYKRHDSELLWKVLRLAWEIGILKGPDWSQIRRSIEIKIDAPEVASRDKLKQAQVDEILQRLGKSLRTIHAEHDLDFDEEKRNREEDGDPTLESEGEQPPAAGMFPESLTEAGCGTGEGGFKGDNKCQKEGGGSKTSKVVAKAEELTPIENSALAGWVAGASTDIRAKEKSGNIDKSIVAFDGALDKQPVHKGEVFKGATVNSERLQKLSSMQPGETITFDASSSTSKKKEISKQFAQPGGLFSNPDNDKSVMFSIRSKTGADIGSKNKGQAEVVLRRGTMYKVTSTKAGGDFDLTVNLEEISESLRESAIDIVDLLCTAHTPLSPAEQGAIVGAMESVTTLEEARAILREYP